MKKDAQRKFKNNSNIVLIELSEFQVSPFLLDLGLSLKTASNAETLEMGKVFK